MAPPRVRAPKACPTRRAKLRWAKSRRHAGALVAALPGGGLDQAVRAEGALAAPAGDVGLALGVVGAVPGAGLVRGRSASRRSGRGAGFGAEMVILCLVGLGRWWRAAVAGAAGAQAGAGAVERRRWPRAGDMARREAMAGGRTSRTRSISLRRCCPAPWSGGETRGRSRAGSRGR